MIKCSNETYWAREARVWPGFISQITDQERNEHDHDQIGQREMQYASSGDQSSGFLGF